MTPDTNMVERVARAILREVWGIEASEVSDLESVLAGDNGASLDLMDVSRAAIAAMREPTEAMIGRAWDGADRGETGVRPEYAWVAMIDAALAEGAKG